MFALIVQSLRNRVNVYRNDENWNTKYDFCYWYFTQKYSVASVKTQTQFVSERVCLV